MEIWKDTERYEERYEISSFGRVRNKHTQQLSCRGVGLQYV